MISSDNLDKMGGKILISAFGIHSGGGGVLLKSLLRGSFERFCILTLDSRLKLNESVKIHGAVKWVPKSMLARFRAINFLSRCCKKNDVLFCFNSLPPIIPVAGRVIVYVHAPHFVNLHVGISYDLISRIRFNIERLWFKIGARYVDEFWVQTESMENGIRKQYPNSNIRIIPFVDDMLADELNEKDLMFPVVNIDDPKFFYPADGVGHKNHVALLMAWEILVNRYGDRCPLLYLTLDKSVSDSLFSKAGVLMATPYIINLGILSRNEVIDQLYTSSALIFPSKAETFGLPLLEAMAARKPILASERDFVRDVCDPTETFDPESPKSIARAVERYLGDKKLKSKFLSAVDLLKEIENSLP